MEASLNPSPPPDLREYSPRSRMERWGELALCQPTRGGLPRLKLLSTSNDVPSLPRSGPANPPSGLPIASPTYPCHNGQKGHCAAVQVVQALLPVLLTAAASVGLSGPLGTNSGTTTHCTHIESSLTRFKINRPHSSFHSYLKSLKYSNQLFPVEKSVKTFNTTYDN